MLQAGIARPLRARALVFAATILAAACADPAAPALLLVTVTETSVSGPSFVSVVDTAPRLQCVLNLTATAERTKEPTGVQWTGGRIFWYFGVGDLPQDSSYIPSEDIGAGWGGTTISSGQTQTAGWTFSAGVPFAATIRFDYGTLDGRRGNASGVVRCGLPARAPDAPDLTLTYTPGSPPPDFGTNLSLDLNARSDAGIWQTLVALSGACTASTVMADTLSHNVTRTVHLLIPRDCRSDLPLQIHAVALDAALQVSSTFIDVQPLVDVTPPQMVIVWIDPPSGGSLQQTLQGEYFVGDSMHFNFTASDNLAVRWMGWEVLPAGARDSVAVNAPLANIAPYLVVRPEWLSPEGSTIRFFARDGVGHLSNIVASAQGAFTFYPTVTKPMVSGTVSGAIADIVVDAKRGRIYLSQPSLLQITALSLTTLQIVSRIPCHPLRMDLTPSGDSLLITLPEAAIGIIDLAHPPIALARVATPGLDTTNFEHAVDIAALANGKAFVSTEGLVSADLRLLEIDLANGAQRFRPDGGFGGQLARSHDGSLMVVNSRTLQSWESSTDTFSPMVTPRLFNFPATLDQTGNQTAISLDIYDRQMGFVKRVRSLVNYEYASYPGALSLDGTMLYHLYGRGILRTSVATGLMLDRILTPANPSLIVLSDDGYTLVTAESNAGTSKVSVTDIR